MSDDCSRGLLLAISGRVLHLFFWRGAKPATLPFLLWLVGEVLLTFGKAIVAHHKGSPFQRPLPPEVIGARYDPEVYRFLA